MYVFGLLPPGDDPVSANYSIDGGPSKTGALSNSSTANTFIGNWSLFTSPQLKYGNHNISIIVNEAGQNGRNYTLDYFQVIQPTSSQIPNDKKSTSAMKSKNNVAVIVGGVMGALECLTLALIFLLWRRRNKAQSKEGRGVPRIPCFGRAKLRNDESMFFSGYLIPYISVGRVSQDIISLGVDPRPPSQSTLVFTQLAETYPANINSLNFSKVTV